MTHALADAFWNHFGSRDERCILVVWANLKVFGHFVAETDALKGLTDVHRALLVRYVEWLNARQRANGKPWTKSSRSGAYTSLRKLLQWLERCRPGILGAIEYPFNPFPWRNRDTQPIRKLSAAQLRAILKACERDRTRRRRRRGARRPRWSASLCRTQRVIPPVHAAPSGRRLSTGMAGLCRLTRRCNARAITRSCGD